MTTNTTVRCHSQSLKFLKCKQIAEIGMFITLVSVEYKMAKHFGKQFDDIGN